MRWFFADGREIPPDIGDMYRFVDWLFVFGASHLFRGMRRGPTREHILGMLDIYMPYAQSDYAYFTVMGGNPVPFQRRVELAVKLRQLFEQWTPPELPLEITETARALLEAEMGSEPIGGWDNVKIEGPEPVEERLWWPEGDPVVLKENTAGGV